MAKSFYTIIFTITVVIAIITLIFMAITMFLGREAAVWPPDVSECPDYWVVNPDGTCSPSGVGNSGSGESCGMFDPQACGNPGSGNNSCLYQDLLKNKGLGLGSPRCRRKAWAQQCGVYWDGISDISPMYCVGSGSTPSPAPSPSHKCPACPSCNLT